MDFDDLDDEIEKRVQEGEEVACHVVENQQPVKGTVLPLMTRTTKLPDFSRLPAAKKKALPPYNGSPVPERSPVLRLLCIHGAADSYAADWCVLENEAPPNVEVAVHEFPGHGHRDDEEFCTTLDGLVDDCFDAFRDVPCMHTLRGERSVWLCSLQPAANLISCFLKQMWDRTTSQISNRVRL